MRVRGVLGSVVAVVVLSATACAGDEPGPPAASTASTPSTEPTSSPTSSTPDVPVPELPDAAAVGDAAGAEAFVKHWVDVLNYAYQTGDTAPVEALSLPGCDVCASAISGIKDTYENGGSMEGGHASVDLVRSPAPDPDGTVIVSTKYAQAALVDSPGSGAPTTFDAVPSQNSGFVLDFIQGEWKLVGIGSE